MPYAVRPEVSGLSPLVDLNLHTLRDVQDRTEPVYGVAVHCTGGGIVDKALSKNADPLEYAVQYYLRPDSFFAHYVIGFDGTLAQIADEHERASHIGFPADDRAAYLTGAWSSRLPLSYVAAWRARWPGLKSPAHLFPGPSPNNVYVGVELLVWRPGCSPTPRGAGKYTDAQYTALADLCRDVAKRWGFPLQQAGRVVCHEDINPLERTSNGQGWDPGVVRTQPHFDWPFFVKLLNV